MEAVNEVKDYADQKGTIANRPCYKIGRVFPQSAKL